MKSTILTSLAALIIAPLAEAQCIGDIAIDARVDGGDLGVLLANWGPVTSTSLSRACDLDGNAIVNGADLGILLSNWGACPAPTWGIIIESQPNPALVTDPILRAAIQATGLPWRVRDRGTGIEMLLIPPGTFQMGCSASFVWPCEESELPVHQVTITQAFYLGRFEVTQHQWQGVAGNNPSYFQGYADSSQRAVEQVSWNDCQWFSAQTGMRLPSEAEWEYACRAGTASAFYNGSDDDLSLVNLAWIDSNAAGQIRAVGGKLPNALGLHDMLGNAWEWVSDWYGAYSSEAQVDPVGPSTSIYLVCRGHSCERSYNDVRSSSRDWGAQDLKHSWTGFRVARNP